MPRVKLGLGFFMQCFSYHAMLSFLHPSICPSTQPSIQCILQAFVKHNYVREAIVSPGNHSSLCACSCAVGLCCPDHQEVQIIISPTESGLTLPFALVLFKKKM